MNENARQPALNYWVVYDPERIARENAEIKRWWDEIPRDRYGCQWSGAALRPAPRFGLERRQ